MTESLLQREERWKREDAANRLQEEVSGLLSMSIEVEEFTSDSGQLPMRYTRRIPVESAPAHFEIPCSEKKCTGGGYDITAAVLEGLRRGLTKFEGTLNCYGSLPESACPRGLRWAVEASFDKAGRDASQANAA